MHIERQDRALAAVLAAKIGSGLEVNPDSVSPPMKDFLARNPGIIEKIKSQPAAGIAVRGPKSRSPQSRLPTYERVDYKDWPRAAKWLERRRRDGEWGVGDTLARYLKRFGAEGWKKAYEWVTKKDCGCADRREKLNRLYPYPIEIIVRCNQSLGDVSLLSAAIREVEKANPNTFLFAPDTFFNDLFDNSPHIVHANQLRCPTRIESGQCWQWANQRSDHLVQEFTRSLIGGINSALHLNLPVPYMTEFRPGLYLSEAEKEKSVADLVGDDLPYWIIDAGYVSNSYTTKRWPAENYQAVVDGLLGGVRFVQIGRDKPGIPDRHSPLKNVINRIGKTENRRDLLRLIYRSSGVVTPISFPMHAAAALPMHGLAGLRPCVVIAGGREPQSMIQYPGHTVLSMVGKMDCCKQGACFKVHVEDWPHDMKGPSQEQCLRPENDIAGCMRRITPAQVIAAVESYLTPKEKPRIAVLSIATDEMKEHRELTFPNKQAYCDRHGYTFVGKTETFHERGKPDRNGSWAKLPFTLELMPRFTHIVCIDADAAFTNMDVKIESLIDEEHDFWVCNDQNGRNCGVMIVKSCQEMWQLFRDAWERGGNSGVYEQQPIGDLLRENPNRISEKVLPQRAMNSYACNWQPGDFVIHAPRDDRWRDRVATLRKFMERSSVLHAVAALTP